MVGHFHKRRHGIVCHVPKKILHWISINHLQSQNIVWIYFKHVKFEIAKWTFGETKYFLVHFYYDCIFDDLVTIIQPLGFTTFFFTLKVCAYSTNMSMQLNCRISSRNYTVYCIALMQIWDEVWILIYEDIESTDQANMKFSLSLYIYIYNSNDFHSHLYCKINTFGYGHLSKFLLQYTIEFSNTAKTVKIFFLLLLLLSRYGCLLLITPNHRSIRYFLQINNDSKAHTYPTYNSIMIVYLF